MERRDFLYRGGMLGAAALLPGCVPTPRHTQVQRTYFAPDTSFTGGACDLPPVHVSADREIRTVVGLRPFRPSGFVVRAEPLGDTLVVHNYGHGGAGITLSWGTAKLAVDIGAPGHHGAAAVLGCGAVGLATARLLQEAGFAVTIYAKNVPPETTSNIAGGQWFPAFLSDPERRSEAFNRQLLVAANYANRRYQLLVGTRFGVRWMRNYFLSDEAFKPSGYLGDDSPLRAMLPEMRDLAPGDHPFAGYTHVRQIDTLLIEPSIYLAAMLDEFLAARGTLVVREFAERAQIVSLPEKLVFNCTGLGAKALFGDDELTPVQGQLTILLPQPEIQYATGADDYYMFPRSDGIVLGGTHVRDQWSLEPDLVAKERVFAAHKKFFDSFRGC